MQFSFFFTIIDLVKVTVEGSLSQGYEGDKRLKIRLFSLFLAQKLAAHASSICFPFDDLLKRALLMPCGKRFCALLTHFESMQGSFASMAFCLEAPLLVFCSNRFAAFSSPHSTLPSIFGLPLFSPLLPKRFTPLLPAVLNL